VLAVTSLSVPERAKRFGREHVQGAHAPEALPGGGQFRWTDDESRFVLPARTRWLVMRLWALHPDLASRAVEVEVEAPCGVALTREFTSAAPITIGIEVPEGVAVIDGVIHVSRTWRPADTGGEDVRDLGIAVAADFVADRQLVLAQDSVERWPDCR
jgi:hypothetical protein